MFSKKYSRTDLRRQCASNARKRLWNALPNNINIIYLQYLFKRHISSPVICIVIKSMVNCQKSQDKVPPECNGACG